MLTICQISSDKCEMLLKDLFPRDLTQIKAQTPIDNINLPIRYKIENTEDIAKIHSKDNVKCKKTQHRLEQLVKTHHPIHL